MELHNGGLDSVERWSYKDDTYLANTWIRQFFIEAENV